MPVSPTASSYAPKLRSDALKQAAPDSGAGRDDRASTLLGWLALVLVVVVGAPIFLCMPRNFDVYHYDICARNLLNGGVHYRDTFDNNLPGIVWLQAGIRWLIGWGSESLHAVDLLFFSIDVLFLLPWVRRGARIWTAAALFAFYLFVPEPVPCQRDIWMLFPAVVGLTLRRRQVERLMLPASPLLPILGAAALEGLCWGAGVWIKPFVLAPALACWLVGLFQVRRTRASAFRPLAADALGLLASGVVAGALGLAWLWWSGSWSYFWDILLVWNRDYGAFASSLGVRYDNLVVFMTLFLPWSIVPCVAAYLAMTAIRREWAGAGSTEPGRPSCALLAAFFLGWLFQGVCLQLPHLYVLGPAVIPAIVLVGATYRWRRLPPARSALRLGVLALAALLWTAAFQLDRLALWSRCCREGSTPQMRSLLVMRKDSAYAVDAAVLADVEDYLRGQGASDGDVTCMSGCTHPLYLDMNLKPSSRFNQIEMTCFFFTKHREVVLAELNAGHARFVVSDLVWAGLTAEEARETDPDDALALPSKFPEKLALMYPWREPIVFRSGRYVVHRVTGPADHCWRDDDSGFEKPADRYSKFFIGNQSFRDEERAHKSLSVIDDLYRRSASAGDRTGQHVALEKALMMRDRARAAGKDPEAAVFGRWIAKRIEGAAAVD
jgi:hypothetical protein